jgi:hypothetical protein
VIEMAAAILQFPKAMSSFEKMALQEARQDLINRGLANPTDAEVRAWWNTLFGLCFDE